MGNKSKRGGESKLAYKKPIFPFLSKYKSHVLPVVVLLEFARKDKLEILIFTTHNILSIWYIDYRNLPQVSNVAILFIFKTSFLELLQLAKAQVLTVQKDII